MTILFKLSGFFAAAGLALLLSAPSRAAGPESGTDRSPAAAAVLASGAVPEFPAGLDRAAVLAALRNYPFCVGERTVVTHAQALRDRFGREIAQATMHLVATDASLSLVDLSRSLEVLQVWTQSGELAAERVAALVAALGEQAGAIVVERTAALAAELPDGELAQLRADVRDRLRRDLVRALAGNASAPAVREVGRALASESPRVRVAAARVARQLPGQPLREQVAALCRDDTTVRDLVCVEK